MDVPDAAPTGRWIGIDRGQNVPLAAATPDGPVIFWKAHVFGMSAVCMLHDARSCKRLGNIGPSRSLNVGNDAL